MKLKCLACRFISACLAAMILVTPVFAEGGGQNDNDSHQDGSSYADTWTNSSWRNTSSIHGFKVSVIINTEGEIVQTAKVGQEGNLLISNFVSFNQMPSYDAYIVDLESTYAHSTASSWLLPTSDRDVLVGMNWDTGKITKTLYTQKLKQLAKIPRDAKSSLSGTLFWDSSGDFAKVCPDPWSPIGDWLAQEFKFQSNTELTEVMLDIITRGFAPSASTGDYRLDLAKAVYVRLNSELQAVISSNLSTTKNPNVLKAGSADAETFKNMVLPISNDCVVGWATVVEPLHTLVNVDNSATILPDEFTEFYGTAMEWGSLMAATRAVPQYLQETYDSMSENTLHQKMEKDAFDAKWSKIMDSPNWKKYGDFTSAHSAIEQNYPKSVFISEGWFGTNTPTLHSEYQPWQVCRGGVGIGMYKNEPVIKEKEPCCYPADPTDDPCPCGGAVPCDCPEGCTCDPDNYTPGCDCVVPNPPVVNVPDPTIEEDHLSQQLNVPNLVSDNCGTDAWYVTFRPEYEGGTYRSDSKISTAEEVVDTKTVEDDYYVQTPGGWWTKHTHEEDVYGTVYYIDNTYTTYKWVLDSFNYDLKIPLDRFTVYSYLKPTQSLDLLKTVSGSPMFRLDGSYKNSHNFTYNRGDTTASVGNIFCDPQDVTWVSHRDELGVESWFNIGLSKYMSIYGTQTSTQNTLYKNIMSTNNVPTRVLNPGETVNAGGSNQVLETNDGSQLRDAFDKTQGNFQFDFQIKGGDDSLKTPDTTKYVPEVTNVETITREFGRFLDQPSTSPLDPDPTPTNFSPWNSVVLNPSNFSQNVNVQGSYAGGKWPYTSGAQGPSVTVSGNGNTWTFITPSDVFTFYPSYKMKAATNANGGEQDVWCLGHIPRTFQGYNKLTIQVNSNANDLDAVWSRDYGDSNTAKAGTAYQFTGGGGSIDITGHFILMDPDFAPDPTVQQQQNAMILAGYESQIKAIVESITENNVYVYSNLYWAGNSPVYQPTIASGFAGKASGRENIKILSKSASGSVGGTTKTFLPGHDGVQTRSHFGATAGDPLGLNGVLCSNLERGSGIVKTWYNEDFEGIITVTMKASINVGQVNTDMALIEENLSDSRTAANALAQPVKVTTTTGQTFTKASGAYAIGVELDIGTVSWGQAQANVICMFDPITFNVRGNAYDMAD